MGKGNFMSLPFFGYERVSKLIDHALVNWGKMSSAEKLELERMIMKYKLSPFQRESLFIATEDSKWLDIQPPLKFYFCYLMAVNLPEKSSNRILSIKVMGDLIPLRSYEHHNKGVMLKALVYLYSLEQTDKVWYEIVRLCNKFTEFKKVYEETGKKEALDMLLSLCGEKKGKRWKSILEIAKPEHKEYLQNVQF
jgi:hypothetical protein